MAQNESAGDEETRKPSLQFAIKTAMAQDPVEPRPAPGSKRQALLMTAGAVALTLGAGVLGAVYQNHQLREVVAASLERQRAVQELERTVQARTADLSQREAAAEAQARAQTVEDRKAAEEFERTMRARQAELARRQSEAEAREQAMTALVRGQQLELSRREAAVETRERAVAAAELRSAEQVAQSEKQAEELRERQKQIEENIEEALLNKRLLTTISLSICNQSGVAIQIARASGDAFSLLERRVIEQWIPIENGACEVARVGPGKAYVYARSVPGGARVWNDVGDRNLQCLSQSAMVADWRHGNVTCSPHEIRAAFMEIDLKQEETTFTFR